MPDEYKPLNQETDPNYNVKPGIIKTPGSKLALEMEKFEQFPSAWGTNPGNPYRYREFPKMVFKAQKINGKPFVMMPDPQRFDYRSRDEFKAAHEQKQRFDSECQRIVKDEREHSRALEDGWRDSPDDAIAFVNDRDDQISRATAEREYADRNVSEAAAAEIKAAKDAVGNEHLPEIPEQPTVKRRCGKCGGTGHNSRTCKSAA